MTALAPPDPVTGTAGFTTAATPLPYVLLTWQVVFGAASYRIFRDGTYIGTVDSFPEQSPRLVDDSYNATGRPAGSHFAVAYHTFTDTVVTPGATYSYSIATVNGLDEMGVGSTPTVVVVPALPEQPEPPPDPEPTGVVKWTFTDLYQAGPSPYTYVFHINPNDGAAVTITKNLAVAKNLGPNRMGIIQEGANQPPSLNFSGIILTQDQFEKMELWFAKRVTLQLTDDLGRTYYGVFDQWTPQRVRHSSNFWFHSYQAQFTCSAYYNAHGTRVFGRIR